MAYLVSHDIGTREIARRTKSFAQLYEESEVEVHAAILRAVEGSGCRLRKSTRRLDGVAKEHDARRLVRVGQQRLPRALYVAHHRIDEIDFALFGRRGRDV